MSNWLAFFVHMSFLFCTVWLVEVQESSENGIKTLDFTLSSKKNQTGHREVTISVDKTSLKLPNTWKVKVMHSVEKRDGLESFHLLGILSAPPPLPEDYELFQGIGYYKLHLSANGFDDALSICAKEGGHLVIINSEAESGVLQTIFRRHQSLIEWAYIGLHDRLKEGEFLTIFGEPLNSTGFNRWFSPSEPNGGTRENCVTVHRNGGMNDGGCESVLPFFCEYDLSWTNP